MRHRCWRRPCWLRAKPAAAEEPGAHIFTHCCRQHTHTQTNVSVRSSVRPPHNGASSSIANGRTFSAISERRRRRQRDAFLTSHNSNDWQRKKEANASKRPPRSSRPFSHPPQTPLEPPVLSSLDSASLFLTHLILFYVYLTITIIISYLYIYIYILSPSHHHHNITTQRQQQHHNNGRKVQDFLRR